MGEGLGEALDSAAGEPLSEPLTVGLCLKSTKFGRSPGLLCGLGRSGAVWWVGGWWTGVRGKSSLYSLCCGAADPQTHRA